MLIVGGGLGGVAAALAAGRRGHRVILASGHDRLGGQLTTQGVPPDEHPWIEMFGATASYRALRRAIRDYYRRHYPLIGRAQRDPYLNPGNAWVSRLAHEPRVAVQVINDLLAPLQASGNLAVWRGYHPTRVTADRDRVRAVTLTGAAGESLTVTADYVLDATELGDLLELGGVEYVAGAEAQAETGEPHASERADPLNQQGFTWVFAVEHRPGEDHTIERPAMYEFWRSYQAPFWPGPHLGWRYPHPITSKTVTARLDFDDPTQAYSGPVGRAPDRGAGKVCRQRGCRRLPHRSAPEHRRRSLHRPGCLAIPDSAGRAPTGTDRERAARRKEHRDHSRHQRLLPAAPRGVEYRRSRGPARRVLPRASPRAPSGASVGRPHGRLPASSGIAGHRA